MNYFFLLLIGFIGFNDSCFSLRLDAHTLLEYAEQGNDQEIYKFFNANKSLSLSQQRNFIFHLRNEIEEKFDITISLMELKDVIIEIVSEMQSDKDVRLIDQALTSLITFPVKNSFQKHILLCKSSEKNEAPNYKNLEDLPDGIIIGGLEALAGAILWITPLKTIGVGMILDGVRRMLKERKAHLTD